MMKCKKCGAELPEDAKFCGICGTPVTEETTEPAENISTPVEKEEPVTEPVEEVKEEVVEPVTEETEAPKEETEDTPEVGEPGIADAVKDTAAAKVILGDDGKLKKDDFVRLGNAAKQGAQTAVKSIAWDEFKTYIDILKDPFGDHALALVPSIVTVVVAVLVGWWAMNSIIDSLLITALLYAGYFLVLFIGHDKEEGKFDGKKAFGKASQLLTVPVLSIFVMCIFSISMRGSINNSAVLYNFSSYLGALRSSIVIIMIFFIFAAIMYVIGMVEIGKKVNKYICAIIITAIFSISMFYMLTQAMNSLISLL